MIDNFKVRAVSDWDDSKSIECRMRCIVVDLNVIHVDGTPNWRDGVDVSDEPKKVWIVSDAPLISLEICGIDRIEAHESHEEAQVEPGKVPAS